jgi:hypothetical protein
MYRPQTKPAHLRRKRSLASFSSLHLDVILTELSRCISHKVHHISLISLKIELLPCTAPWFARAIRAWWSAPSEAIPDIQQMISFYVSLQNDHIHLPVL